MISTLLKSAKILFPEVCEGAETSSVVENTYDVSFANPTATNPACSVILGISVTFLFGTVTLNDTSAVDAVLDRGTYPIFRANETTFSLNVAESKKDSLTIILELKAVI